MKRYLFAAVAAWIAIAGLLAAFNSGHSQSIPFPGPGMTHGCGAATQIFSGSPTDGGANYSTYSVRQVITNSGTAGNQVRVTFIGTTGGTSWSNMSVGVQSSTYTTVATPALLLISGSPGVSGLGFTATPSDWAVLTVGSSDKLVVVMDNQAGSLVSFVTTGNPGDYVKISTASYNQAAPAGFGTDFAAGLLSITKVEVRTC